MTSFIKKILFPIFLFTAVFLIVLHFLNRSNTVDNNYTLKAYKNTVALYNGEKMITVYEGIVLNTLPQKDIQNFNKGISFSSTNQAEIYLEDFE